MSSTAVHRPIRRRLASRFARSLRRSLPFTLAVAALVATPSASAADNTGDVLNREGLARCAELEREARALLERHRAEHAALAPEGRAIDRDRGELDRMREATDRHEPATIARYNEAAASLDERVRRYNGQVGALEAIREAQHAAAARYNADCGGRTHRSDDAPGR